MGARLVGGVYGNAQMGRFIVSRVSCRVYTLDYLHLITPDDLLQFPHMHFNTCMYVRMLCIGLAIYTIEYLNIHISYIYIYTVLSLYVYRSGADVCPKSTESHAGLQSFVLLRLLLFATCQLIVILGFGLTVPEMVPKSP